MSAIRSLLFVPADSERKIAKGLEGDADALILDLEDSVAPDAKKRARDVLRGVGGAAKPLFVRVNPFGSGETEEDLTAAMSLAPFGLVLPKSANGAAVARLHALLDVAEAEAGLAEGSTRILPIATETAAATLAAGSYAGVSTRLWGMTWGAEDLATDLGAMAKRHEDGRLREPFRFARAHCLFGAAAAGLRAVDTIFAEFRDETALRRECHDAALDGFVAKMAIHPAQVGPINEAFTPSPEAIREARAVVEAFRAAGDPGVVALDGRMLDRPHLLLARKVLARTERR